MGQTWLVTGQVTTVTLSWGCSFWHRDQAEPRGTGYNLRSTPRPLQAGTSLHFWVLSRAGGTWMKSSRSKTLLMEASLPKPHLDPNQNFFAITCQFLQMFFEVRGSKHSPRLFQGQCWSVIFHFWHCVFGTFSLKYTKIFKDILLHIKGNNVFHDVKFKIPTQESKQNIFSY